MAKMLAEIGFDAVEVSGGMWEATTRSKEDLGSRAPARVPNWHSQQGTGGILPARCKGGKRKNGHICGRLSIFQQVEEALASGAVDFVSLSRSLVRQPDLPKLWYTRQRGVLSRISGLSHDVLPPTQTTLCSVQPVAIRRNESWSTVTPEQLIAYEHSQPPLYVQSCSSTVQNIEKQLARLLPPMFQNASSGFF